MFLPTSPRPPSGMIRSASLTGLSLRAGLEGKDVDGVRVAVDPLRMDRDRVVLRSERVERRKRHIRLLVTQCERPLALDHRELDLVARDALELDDPNGLRDGSPRVPLAPRS